MKDMQDPWEEELVDLDLGFDDALDAPVCPRCNSSTYQHDKEFAAWICEECGLWDEDEPE